jgi:hypothetical protein
MIKFYGKVLREEMQMDVPKVLLEATDGLHRCWMTKAEFEAFQVEADPVVEAKPEPKAVIDRKKPSVPPSEL